MKLLNMAKMTVSGAPGTGTITLSAAVSGYLTFAQAGVADGDWVTYCIIDGSNCEVGRGQYTSSGTTLSRGRVLRSTGAGNTAAISATSSAVVFIAAAAEDLVPSGAVMFTMATSAQDGWLLFDDGTIGDGSSSASSRANADCKDVFFMLYNNFADADCAITTSAGAGTTRAGQTNAATAWAAHCRIALPKALGRALAVAGAGSGLTSRALGKSVGEETHTPTLAEMFAHTHSVPSGGGGGTISPGCNAGYGGAQTTGSQGSSTAHNVMQPTTFLNAMVKL